METAEPPNIPTLRGIMCKVCGEQASGYHYGVDTCSACKIFFRRNCDRDVKHRCDKGSNVRKSRRKYPKPQVLTCPGCRLEKCNEVGMAVEAIRKGRYTYSVKYEYFKKAQKTVEESDGLDEEGNSIEDNRTSSESSDLQSSDAGDDILALSIQREIEDLNSAHEETYTNGSPSSSSESETLSPGKYNEKRDATSFDSRAKESSENQATEPFQNIEEAARLFSDTAAESVSNSNNVVKNGMKENAATWDVVPVHRSDIQEITIVRQPSNILEDVENLASRLSAMFVSCSTFSPGFFDRIRDIEQCYVNHKLMNTALDMKPLAADEYKAFYDTTGIDVDGRQERLTSRFISLERRLRSYVTFVKKIQGFAELPNIDQERLFKAGHTELGCLSEYRSYNVCLGLRTLPEGIVLDYQDLLCTSHGDYVDMLFNLADRLQKLHLTEDMCNLLKCTALFSPEFCVTDIGRKRTAKQQNLMLRALELLLRHKHPRGEDILSKAIIILSDMKLLRTRCAREIQMTSREFPQIYTPQLVNEVCLEEW